jgi:hypothetical protein
MFPVSESGFDQPLPPSPAVHAPVGQMNPWERMERAIPIKEQFDTLRNWRERLSPRFRRASSAAKLLFQFVGVAGYAGYFTSMHTFMRIVSGVLMAVAWFAIYKIKEAVRFERSE